MLDKSEYETSAVQNQTESPESNTSTTVQHEWLNNRQYDNVK